MSATFVLSPSAMSLTPGFSPVCASVQPSTPFQRLLETRVFKYLAEARRLIGWSLHRICRYDVDLLDRHSCGRLAHFAHAVSRHQCVADFLEHVIALNQFSERR